MNNRDYARLVLSGNDNGPVFDRTACGAAVWPYEPHGRPTAEWQRRPSGLHVPTGSATKVINTRKGIIGGNKGPDWLP